MFNPFPATNWEDVSLKKCAVLCYMELLLRHNLHIYWVHHGNSVAVYLCNNQVRVVGDSVPSNINHFVGNFIFVYSF